MDPFKGKSVLDISHIAFLRKLIKECNRPDITKTFETFIDYNYIPLTLIETNNPPFSFSFEIRAIHGVANLVDKLRLYLSNTIFNVPNRDLVIITPKEITSKEYNMLLEEIARKTVDDSFELKLLHPLKFAYFGTVYGHLIKRSTFHFLVDEIDQSTFRSLQPSKSKKSYAREMEETMRILNEREPHPSSLRTSNRPWEISLAPVPEIGPGTAQTIEDSPPVRSERGTETTQPSRAFRELLNNYPSLAPRSIDISLRDDNIDDDDNDT
jgi:hypothetical protein